MKKILAIAAICFFLSAVSPVNGSYTQVSGPGEVEIANLLCGIYSDTFAPTGQSASQYTSTGGIVATRVDDTLNPLANLNIHSSVPGNGSTDQIWQDGITVFNVEAKFAGYSQSFGITDPAGSGGYVELFNVNANGYLSIGPALVTISGPTFTLDRSDIGNGALPGNLHWSSDASLNSDRQDHMITFEITNYSNLKTWLVLWDDQVAGATDRDFNDFAIQIQVIPTPSPSAILLASLGVGLVGWLRGRRTL